MKTYSVWMEGYFLNGMHAPAVPSLLGTTQAESFGEACLAVCKTLRWPQYSNVPFENMFRAGDPPTYWGCRLYRTCEEAANEGLQSNARATGAHSALRYAV